MGVKLRPELSKKNKYWIDKNRFYELKYFCLQYPLWKKAYEVLDGLQLCSYELAPSKSNLPGDITGNCVEERLRYFERSSRDTYYDRYRRFFWLLDNKRNTYI